jgi:hypothetical protein
MKLPPSVSVGEVKYYSAFWKKVRGTGMELNFTSSEFRRRTNNMLKKG